MLHSRIRSLKLLEGLVLDVEGLRSLLAVLVIVSACLYLNVDLFPEIAILHNDRRVLAAEDRVVGANNYFLGEGQLNDGCRG